MATLLNVTNVMFLSYSNLKIDQNYAFFDTALGTLFDCFIISNLPGFFMWIALQEKFMRWIQVETAITNWSVSFCMCI